MQYQQTQSEEVERAMLEAKFVASFIGHEPGKALFVGLYSIGKTRPLSYSGDQRSNGTAWARTSSGLPFFVPPLRDSGERPCRRYRTAGPALRNHFFVARRFLVAAALSARDRAVAPFNRGSHHAAALSWADGDAAWTNADGGVIAPTIPVVAVGAVPPDLNIDTLGHFEVLSLGGSGRRRSRQHRCGCRQDESELHHQASS
jgi:hypothetical protein